MSFSSTRLRAILVEEVLPFWLRHGVDQKNGGIFTSLDSDGSLVDSDKSIWMQGRAAWMFAHAYRHVDPNPEWLAVAMSAASFLLDHGKDQRGRLQFLVTEAGEPLRSRRYAYAEAFAALGLGELAAVTHDSRLKKEAQGFAEFFYEHDGDTDHFPEKWHGETRPVIALAPNMMALGLSQALEASCGCPGGQNLRDRAIANLTLCAKSEGVYEMVSPNGKVISSFDGRTLNPGHGLEAAWFVMEEAICRADGNGNPEGTLADIGLSMAETSWNIGWDEKHGGILYFVSADHKPIQEYWQNQKFWWPQCEAIIAALYAWRLSKDSKWLERAQSAWKWFEKNHRDPVHGECWGWLDQNGQTIQSLKGSQWKGPFHYPRMLWKASQMLDEASSI
jgi:N-acylglucosamine 2-epimerase